MKNNAQNDTEFIPILDGWKPQTFMVLFLAVAVVPIIVLAFCKEVLYQAAKWVGMRFA